MEGADGNASTSEGDGVAQHSLESSREGSALNKPELAADGAAEDNQVAAGGGEAAADNSTIPARRRQRDLLGQHSSAIITMLQPNAFRRALRAASGGWSDLLTRFSKGAEDGGGTSTRRPRPLGQPNVAITTAIPPNPCGCGAAFSSAPAARGFSARQMAAMVFLSAKFA